MVSSTEDISIDPPHNVPVTACVGRTAIIPQLPNSKGFPGAAVPRRHRRGEGPLAGSGSAGRTACQPALLPTSRSLGAAPGAPCHPGSALPELRRSQVILQSRVKPSLLPEDFFWLAQASLSGSSRAAIKHPDDLTTTTDSSAF